MKNKFNIGEYGFITDSPSRVKGLKKKSYDTWVKMILRCYDENCSGYKWYGGKGITVCLEWRKYSAFEAWYDLKYVDGYHVDKDIGSKKLGLEIGIYSPETCAFISPSDNTKESNKRRGYGSKQWYASHSVPRWSFVEECKKRLWDFKQFKEIYDKTRENGEKKFFYIELKQGEKNTEYKEYIPKMYNISIHKEKPISISNFKRACKKRGLNYYDFDKIKSNEKEACGVKKYFFKQKAGVK